MTTLYYRIALNLIMNLHIHLYIFIYHSSFIGLQWIFLLSMYIL